MTDFPDWSAAVAPVRGAKLVNVTQTGTIAGGGNKTLYTGAALQQPSWEAFLNVALPAAVGTNPFCQLAYEWFNSDGTFVTAFRFYYFSVGNGNVNSLQYQGTGPCRGETVTITLINLDPAQTLSYTMDLEQTSHLFTVDRWQQQQYASTAPNGFANPSGEPESNVIAVSSPPLTPGGTQSRLCAVVSGKWRVELDNQAGANACLLTLADPMAAGPLFGATWRTAQVAASGSFDTEFWSPFRPVLVSVKNLGATGNITPNLAVIAAEY